jgi:hypothetical protein
MRLAEMQLGLEQADEPGHAAERADTRPGGGR